MSTQKNEASIYPYAEMFSTFCMDMENEIVIPVCQKRVDMAKLERMFSTLGSWDSFKTVMREMLDEESYYQNENEELQEENSKLIQELKDIKEEVADVVSDLEWHKTDIGDGNKEYYMKLLDRLSNVCEEEYKKVKKSRD